MSAAQGWIGVDLDGTLAHYDRWRGIEHVGEPIKPMCDRVRKWLAEGREVRIFTARVSTGIGKNSGKDETLADIAAPIIAFSKREFGRALDITCIKDFGMIELWDDRAIRVRCNEGNPCCADRAE